MRRVSEVYTPEEVRSMIRICSAVWPGGIRDRALIAVLYRTGLRINEALELRPNDVDFAAHKLFVRCGKGSRHSKGPVPRIVGIDNSALRLVRLWLSRRKALDLGLRLGLRLPDLAPLFCTLRGSKLHSQQVRQMLARVARRAGISKRVHPHGFRHTLASELLAEGVEMGIISKQLGHKSIATTAIYLDHVAPQRVLDTMGARKWQSSGLGVASCTD